MKKSGFINSILLLAILLLMLACDGVLVPDPIDPRIPKYTEDGNNAAGAFVNSSVWVSNIKFDFPYTYYIPFIKSWPEKDSLVIYFSGQNNNRDASITFSLTGVNILKFDDLTSLNGKIFQLDGVNNSGFYYDYYTPVSYEDKGVGQIYLRNIKKNETYDNMIISGTFGFTVNYISGQEKKITYGRFDYKISENINFELE